MGEAMTRCESYERNVGVALRGVRLSRGMVDKLSFHRVVQACDGVVYLYGKGYLISQPYSHTNDSCALLSI